MSKLFLVNGNTGHITEKEVEVVYTDKNGIIYRPGDEKGIVLDENTARRLSSEIMASNLKKMNMDWINRIIATFMEDLPNELYHKIFDILSPVFSEQREMIIDNIRYYFIGWKDYDTVLFYSLNDERRLILGSKRLNTDVFTADELDYIISRRSVNPKE